MVTTVEAYAADAAGEPLHPVELRPGDLAPDEVDIDVARCGMCYSDVCMLDNDWGSPPTR